jgi:hypothetical protein
MLYRKVAMEDDFDEEYYDEDDDIASEQVLGYLIDIGAAYYDGVDGTGERMFRFNMDMLKEVLPDLYDTIMEDLDNTMLELYEKGLAEVEYDEELNAHFKISEEGKSILHDLGFGSFTEEN